jgi:ACS family pantothenate transporter-like MFS transporter
MPTGTSLISATCVVLWGFLSDCTGSRFLWLLIPMVRYTVYINLCSATADIAQVLGLVPNGILAVWPASLALKKFAFLTVNIHLVTAVL